MAETASATLLWSNKDARVSAILGDGNVEIGASEIFDE